MEIRTKLITDLPLSEVLGGTEIFPVNQFGVAKKASTQDIINFTTKQEYATWVYKASTNLETVDLSTRYIKLINTPIDQEPFPEFFIGEAGFYSFQGEVSSLSGFKFNYNDQTDRFLFVSYASAASASTRELTAYYIDPNAYMYITNLSTSNTLSSKNIYVTDQVVISANTNNDALFIVQSGGGNAIEVFDQINDTTPFVITASGNVGVKTPTPFVDLTIAGNVSASQTLSARNIHVLERVGVATASPNETLTVAGNISARNVIFDARGNSNQWFETYTRYSAASGNEAMVASFVNANSANIRNVNTKVNATSGNWDSVYSHMQANTGSLYATRTYVGNNSANFSDSIARYNAISATYTTFAYTNGFLPLSGGTVSSGTLGVSGQATFASDVTILGRLSAFNFTVVQADVIPITASTLSVDGSGNFEGNFRVGGNSNLLGNLTVTGFANVSSTITADNIITSRQYLRDLNGDSRQWNSAYQRWNAVSALDLQVRNFTNSNSANIRNVNTVVNTTSSNWNQVYSAVIPSSANWNSNYSHWNANSGLIFMARNFVTSNSANSLNVNTKVNSTSSNWDRTYSTWSPISAITTGTTTFVSQTSSLTQRVNTYVSTTSSTFILNGGNAGATTIGTTNNTTLTLETNNTGRVTITGAGNVGINQTSPTSKLHIVDNTANPAALIVQSGAGNGLKITQTGTGDALVVEDQANDTTPFVIKTDGKIGIGKSSPAHQLDVSGTIYADHLGVPNYGVIGLNLTYDNVNDIRWEYLGNGHGYAVYQTDNKFIIGHAPNNTLGSGSLAPVTNRLVIDTSGNLGINNSNPTQKLDVGGNIKSTGIIYDSVGNSSNWNSAYGTFFTLSAAIGEGLTEFQESSARYNRVSTRVEITSANWNSVYSTFQSNSGKYNSERGVVNIPLSGTSVITVPNHTIGFMDIYLNGIKLVKPDDFSETATTITLTEPTKYNNYKLEYVVYGAYNVANAVARTGDTMTGDLVVPNLTITGSLLGIPTLYVNRNNSTNEGGEIQIARASDNQPKYYIDVYGSGSDPSLRIFERINSSYPVRAFIQGGTGNVGINTTNPTSRIYIYQDHATQVAAAIQTSAGSSGDALWISHAGSGAGLRMINTGSGPCVRIEDQSSDTTPFIIDASGNVGINTSSPTANLTVSGIGQFQNVQWLGPDSVTRPVVELNENNSVYLNTPNNIFLGLSSFYQNPNPNIINLSDPYDLLPWTVSRTLIRYNNIQTAPDGNKHKILEVYINSASSGGAKAIVEDTPFDEITNYTFSVYLKPEGPYTVARLYFTTTGGAFSSAIYVDFNLDTATIRNSSGTITGSIKSVGGGWCLCSITATNNAVANGRLQINSYLPNGTTSVFNPPAGVSDTLLYAWRAKLEKGTSSTNNLPDISIQSNGNVGLGVANSTEKLTVVGNISATGTIYGDGTGLKNLDLTRKFLSWPIKDNYVGNPQVFRINSFLSTDKKIYIAGYAYNYSTTFGQNEGNRAYAYPGFQAMHIYGEDSAIPNDETVERFWAGSRYFMCQTNTDRVYAIGINHRGQLGVGNTNQIFMWTLVANLPNISKISLYNGTQHTYFDDSYLHTLFVTKDNRLYGCGYNFYGQLGLGATSNVNNSPQLINVGAIQNKNIVEAYVVGDDLNAYGSSFCIDSDRNLYFTGYQVHGHGGLNDTVQRNSFVQVPNIKADKISSVGYNGEATTFVLDKQLGALYSAGNNGVLQLGVAGGNRSTFAVVTNLGSGVADFASGSVRNGACIAIMTDGSVRTWGRNTNGLLGHNGTTNIATPTIPTNLQGRVFLKARIVSGYRTGEWPTSYLLDNQGNIWSSGYNGYGQRGIGTTTDNLLYTRMRKPSNVYFVDFETWGFNSGTGVTALDSDGNLWSCGYHNEHSGGLTIAAQAIPTLQRCTIN